MVPEADYSILGLEVVEEVRDWDYTEHFTTLVVGHRSCWVIGLFLLYIWDQSLVGQVDVSPLTFCVEVCVPGAIRGV